MNLSPPLTKSLNSPACGFNIDEIKNIHSILNKFPHRSQLSLAKIVNGHPQFYGVIKQDGLINSIANADATFDIGSVAKVFTSALLAQNVLNGKLSLDDDIAEHLKLTLKNNARITFKQLANHTSGLPRLPPGMLWESLFKNADNPYKDYSEARLLAYLQHKIKQKSTDKCRYSNLGAGLLGYALSRINDCSYEELLQKNLCKPLELNSTTTQIKQVKEKLVMGQNKQGKEVPFWQLAALTGAGGIYSSVNDLVKFILANFDKSNAEFHLQHKITHQINPTMSVALGWFSIGKQSDQQCDKHAPCLWHDGGTAGFSSQIIMDVNNKNGLVLLSNISAMQLRKGEVLGHLAKELFENISIN